MAGVILPKIHDSDTEFTVRLVLNGPYRHGAKGD